KRTLTTSPPSSTWAFFRPSRSSAPRRRSATSSASSTRHRASTRPAPRPSGSCRRRRPPSPSKEERNDDTANEPPSAPRLLRPRARDGVLVRRGCSAEEANPEATGRGARREQEAEPRERRRWQRFPRWQGAGPEGHGGRRRAKDARRRHAGVSL